MKHNTLQSNAPITLTSAIDLTNRINTPVKYLIPYFIEQAASTFIKLERGAECGAYPSRIAQAISGGLTLPPYGHGEPSKVALLMGQGSMRSDALELRAILSTGKDMDAIALAEKNLQIFQPQDAGTQLLNLRDAAVVERLCNLLIGQVDCVVISNLDSCIQAVSSDKDGRSLGDLFVALNKGGVSVVCFGSAALFNRIESELAPAGRCQITFHHDPSAPTEVGGGFIVKRKRVDIHDPIPRQFRYYYQIVAGMFDDQFSMEDVGQQTLKQLEVLRRRMEVARLMAQGMSQKDIAEQMELTAATVCRDAEVVKSKEGTRSRLAEIAPFQSGAGA